MTHDWAPAEHSNHEHEHHASDVPDDHDFAAANQKHFDAEAVAFDAKPAAIELAHRIVTSTVKKYPALFDEESTTVLDFACGSGRLSIYFSIE